SPGGAPAPDEGGASGSRRLDLSRHAYQRRKGAAPQATSVTPVHDTRRGRAKDRPGKRRSPGEKRPATRRLEPEGVAVEVVALQLVTGLRGVIGAGKPGKAGAHEAPVVA